MVNVSKSWPVMVKFQGGTRLELDVIKATQNHNEYYFKCEDGDDVTVPKYNVLYVLEKKHVNEEE